MTSSALRIGAIVVLVVLAGCSGPLSGTPDGDREAYGVDDELESSIDDENDLGTELLPGLTTVGVVDTPSLLEAHDEALGDRPYTIRSEVRVESTNGTWEYGLEQVRKIDPESETASQTTRQHIDLPNDSGLFTDDVSNGTVEIWEEGDERLIRTEYENGSVEYGPPHLGGLSGTGALVISPQRMLQTVTTIDENHTSVTALDADDGRYYVVRGNETFDVDEIDTGNDQNAVTENISIHLFVREDGLVRQSVLEATIIDRGERLVGTEAVTISDIGENRTSVERPDWYEDALEATRGDAPPGEEADGTDHDASDERTDDTGERADSRERANDGHD